MNNFAGILTIVEEIAQAGPQALKLVKDVVTAIDDFRTGKVTAAEFAAILDDVKGIAAQVVK